MARGWGGVEGRERMQNQGGVVVPPRNVGGVVGPPRNLGGVEASRGGSSELRSTQELTMGVEVLEDIVVAPAQSKTSVTLPDWRQPSSDSI